MKTKCLLCTALTETGQGFYDHLEDVHMMPIRRGRIGENGSPREETHVNVWKDLCLTTKNMVLIYVGVQIVLVVKL